MSECEVPLNKAHWLTRLAMCQWPSVLIGRKRVLYSRAFWCLFTMLVVEPRGRNLLVLSTRFQRGVSTRFGVTMPGGVTFTWNDG